MLIYNTLPYKLPFIRCALSDTAHIRLYGKYMMIVVHHNTDYIIGIHRGPNLIVCFSHDNSSVSTRMFVSMGYYIYANQPLWADQEVYGFEATRHCIPFIDKTNGKLKYNILGFILKCGFGDLFTNKLRADIII